MQNINKLKESDQVKSTYLVQNVLKGKASNGSDYLSIKLQDATGDIEAKLWSATSEQINEIKNGVFLYVEGNCLKYRDTLQMKIDATKIVAESEVELERFVRSAPVDKIELRNELQQFIYDIDDRVINTVVSALVKEYDEQLQLYPAASKNHHAYNGGLLYHVVSMLKLAKALVNLYPALNKNYLYAGIIIHDLGKIEELSGVVATEYTTKGKLLGHISILSATISRIANEVNELDSEQVMILQHLVLSHHGKMEYGSPVLPMTMEAEILTFIDNIDARMDIMSRVLEGVEEGGFTSRVFPLENRSFYKPKK